MKLKKRIMACVVAAAVVVTSAVTAIQFLMVRDAL